MGGDGWVSLPCSCVFVVVLLECNWRNMYALQPTTTHDPPPTACLGLQAVCPRRQPQAL